MAEVYTDPAAQAAVLGMGPSPENQQIAAQVLEKGPQAVLQEAQQPMPPAPSPDTAPTPSGETMVPPPPPGMGLPERTPEEMEAMRLMETRSEWLLLHQEEKVPWGDETWGEFINTVHDRAEKEEEGSGVEAAGEFIDQQIENERREQEKKAPSNVLVMPTAGLPGNEAQMAAAANQINAAQGPAAGQQGIMAAANGGLVRFAEGGMNQGALDPKEFMSLLTQEAENAGIAPEELDQVAETAVQSVPQGAANDNVLDTGIMQTVEAVEANETDLSGIGSLEGINRQLVEAGKEGLIHATPGELVFDPSRLNEPDQRMLLAALETAGIDPDAATVGNSANILNEMTGLPAFGFFSGIGKFFKGIGKAVKKVGKFLKKNAGTILGIAGAMTGMPWLAALGAGVGSLIEGKPLKIALLSAGMSFVGTKWVSPWISKQIQGIGALGIGKAMQTPVGDVLGSAAKGLQAGVSPGAMGGFASSVGSATTQGVALKTAEQAGMTAAVDSILAGGNAAAVKTATETAILGALPANVAAGVASSASDVAANIAQSAIEQTTSGFFGSGITSAAQATLPVGGASLGTWAQQAMARPIADVAAGAITGVGQRAAQSYVDSMFETPQQEQEALAAWNQRYNYTPSAQELYQFYTQEYIPGLQVDTSIIGGTPGFTQPVQTAQSSLPPVPGIQPIFSAAGGGYVNGIGGPKTDSNLARLSDGEFVMTEPAVRGAGYGDRELGAQRMAGIMQHFETRAA